jgi:hypothetical protein
LRTHILKYDAHPFVGQQPEADRRRMDALIAPGHLLQVIDSLIRQHLLLKRDGVALENAILRRLDRSGTWV